MEKKEIIERTKKAYQLYKENKIYQAFKEIYPVAQIIKTEKVQKLYKVLIIKAKQLLEDLYKNREYNKLEEIEYMFFEGVNIPAITNIFNKAKEERKKFLEEIAEEEEELQEDYSSVSLSDNENIFPEETGSDNESESFEFDAEKFKLSSFSEDEMEEKDVNALIQKGVSLYEVGDIENALVVWEQALQLQPDNPFLKDYIANARNELGIESSDTEDNQSSEEESNDKVQQISLEHSDSEMKQDEEIEIVFNENELEGELKRAIAIARSGDTERARLMLKNLLENNQIDENKYSSTIKFISKIEGEIGISILKNKIKNMVEDKDFEGALEFLKRNKDRFSFEEANKIEQFILQKRQEETLTQSFELELEEDPEPKITRRPKQIDKTKKLKQKTKVKPKKKSRSVSVFFKTTFLFLLLIIVLAVVIFYGVKAIQSNIQSEEVAFDIKTFQLREREQQKKKQFQKYLKEARNYFDLGEYLFAYYTYLHAERYGQLDEQQIAFLSRARRLMKQEKINKRREFKLAERYYKSGKFEKAIPHYKNLLSENPENLEIKKKLFVCYKKAAIKYALSKNVLKAKTLFNYALVLNRNDADIPKHLKVLDRYLKGKINQKLLTQWFYFYIK